MTQAKPWGKLRRRLEYQGRLQKETSERLIQEAKELKKKYLEGDTDATKKVKEVYQSLKKGVGKGTIKREVLFEFEKEYNLINDKED